SAAVAFQMDMHTMKTSAAHYAAIGLVVLFGACATLYFSHDMTFSELQARFFLGRDGVRMILPPNDEVVTFDPWTALEKNLSLNQMLAQLCTDAGAPDICFRDASVRFEIFRKDHFVSVGGNQYLLERNATPIKLSEITPTYLDE